MWHDWHGCVAHSQKYVSSKWPECLLLLAMDTAVATGVQTIHMMESLHVLNRAELPAARCSKDVDWQQLRTFLCHCRRF